MDRHAHDQQQKDFLSSFFGTDSSSDQLQRPPDSMQQNIFNSAMSTAPPTPQPTMNMQSFQQSNSMFGAADILGNMMQGIETQQNPCTPQMVLEQQLRLAKLQQLQQLQNQIFQQQLELISGQQNPSSPMSVDGPRDPPYHGLPTPISSTELRPQPSTDFVSPMILHYQSQETSRNELPPFMNHHTSPNFGPHHGSSYPSTSTSARSAPANLAFNTSPPVSLHSGADLDFDISPLTSPWFGAQTGPSLSIPNKRTASSSGDEASGTSIRKRQSPAIRPVNPMPGSKKSMRGTKSANSTPLLRSTRSRRGSTTADVPGDTPSPVDLSMPPPAPPPMHGTNNNNNNTTSPNPNMGGMISPPSSSSSGSLTPLAAHPNSNGVVPSNQNLTPVTPASIMNLGIDLNSGLSRPGTLKADLRAKSHMKSKSVVENAHGGKLPLRKDSAISLVSPSLKPILPAGGSSSLNTTSNSLQTLPGRKTSHKAAEQKRRDSLKTTFDDLRMLLPPIPLPNGEGFADEPVLPGSMPPRGPPKGEGPNRGVSKLQLLRCGNEYIRQLKGRVERRDEEIGKLRREIVRLRGLVSTVGEDTVNEDEMVDLEKDLDAVEIGGAGLRGAVGDGNDADDDDDD
ncbi:hypothetical protein JAAARDRAFT_176786 [Jaapia argillacea MUCL 33604]|uniref:BHLH domain-containing protein n=1 Tax=Jaapia argillacea MUCL 33604 TaxID=933084 RepID=A0A067PV68_9AGAM|nr:hypothetical protein JAAARDRAFT_176786 [Jaapia argillacea MUCL 33604]